AGSPSGSAQQPDDFGQRPGRADVAGEDDVGNARVAAARARSPAGDAEGDLPGHLGAADAERLGREIAGGDAALRDQVAGSGFQAKDRFDQGGGNPPAQVQVRLVAAGPDELTAGEEDGVPPGPQGSIDGGRGAGDCRLAHRLVQNIADTELDRYKLRQGGPRGRQLLGRAANVGTDDDQAAGVGGTVPVELGVGQQGPAGLSDPDPYEA